MSILIGRVYNHNNFYPLIKKNGCTMLIPSLPRFYSIDFALTLSRFINDKIFIFNENGNKTLNSYLLDIDGLDITIFDSKWQEGSPTVMLDYNHVINRLRLSKNKEIYLLAGDIMYFTKPDFLNEIKNKSSINIKNTSICIHITKEILIDIIKEHKDMDYSKIFLSAREISKAMEIDGIISQLNDIKEYYKIGMDIINNRNKYIDYFNSFPISTLMGGKKQAKIERGGNVINSLIANGANVAGNVVESIIFPFSQVKKKAKIERSIIMPGNLIDSNANIKYAIIGASRAYRSDKPSIGNGAIIEGSDRKPCVVGEGVYIGRKAIIKEAIIDKNIEAGKRIK